MNLLILDLETTDPDPKKARIIEIGCCLWSVDYGTTLTSFSTLVAEPENPAEHINGIPAAALTDATWVERAFSTVGHFVAKAALIAAHNGDEYDRIVLERYACPWVAPKPWLDTMEIDWPRKSSSRKLIDIALSHGLGVSSAHRALDDVMMIARLFERSRELGSDVSRMIALAMRPKSIFEVADRGFSEERNRLAKENLFRWHPETKSWRRKMVPTDTSTLPFEVREIP